MPILFTFKVVPAYSVGLDA